MVGLVGRGISGLGGGGGRRRRGKSGGGFSFSPFPCVIIFSISQTPSSCYERKRSQKSAASVSFFFPTPQPTFFFLAAAEAMLLPTPGLFFCLPKVWGERGLFLGLHFQVYNKNYSALFPGPGERGGVIQYIFWTKIIWDIFFLKGSLVGF